jgi:hypothetical protein
MRGTIKTRAHTIDPTLFIGGLPVLSSDCLGYRSGGGEGIIDEGILGNRGRKGAGSSAGIRERL